MGGGGVSASSTAMSAATHSATADAATAVKPAASAESDKAGFLVAGTLLFGVPGRVVFVLWSVLGLGLGLRSSFSC